MSKKRREQGPGKQPRKAKKSTDQPVELPPDEAEPGPSDATEVECHAGNLPPGAAFVAEQSLWEMFGPSAENEAAQAFVRAQKLAYRAMSARTAEQAARLAAEALAIYPACVDALVVAAQLANEDEDGLIEDLRRIVEIGADDLGEEYFQENRGQFWGLLETRPYMRARAYLAQLLQTTGRLDEAAQELEALLDLNPDDNQGLRYALLSCYLTSNNLPGAGRLLKEYEMDGSAFFTWARVLERYLSGDQPGAERALAAARHGNPHVEQYLTGRKKLPKTLPEFYGFGDANEAIACACEIGPAWQAHPQALAWLAGAAA